MTTKDFIEKAIEGGWKYKQEDCIKAVYTYHPYFKDRAECTMKRGTTCYRYLSDIVLDHKAWEAVGKVEGWSEQGILNRFGVNMYNHPYQTYMVLLMEYLAHGGAIETYIKDL